MSDMIEENEYSNLFEMFCVFIIICNLICICICCTVGPNVLGWTFPIEGAGRRQRRARLRVIIGGIMGNGQATIVYLKWLLAVSMLSSSFLQIVLVKVLVR